MILIRLSRLGMVALLALSAVQSNADVLAVISPLSSPAIGPPD